MPYRSICFISPKFSDYIGGMETHAIEFVNFFLSDKDYPIKSIFTRETVDDGVSSPHREKPYKIRKILYPVLTGDFEKDAIIIEKNSNPKEDIYYLNSPNWLPAATILKKKYSEMKIIVRSGGNDIVAGWVGSEKYGKINLEETRTTIVNLINEFVDVLIVNSSYSLKRTLELGVSKKKIIKILGGVDCKKFMPVNEYIGMLDSPIQIVTAARMVKFKGVECNLKAIKIAIEKYNLDLRYTVIGDGPERENLEKISNSLGISKQVYFMGAVEFTDIPKSINDKHIFLHLPIYLRKEERNSSYIHTETMGRCLCEAAACGLPVVTSNVGGIPEIVKDRETGFIVNEGDYEAAAVKIVELARNKTLRKKMGNDARNKALKLFNFENIFHLYKEVFSHDARN